MFRTEVASGTYIVEADHASIGYGRTVSFLLREDDSRVIAADLGAFDSLIAPIHERAAAVDGR